mmetsp:Transcript_17728/g.50545  ORF Transcript_17728/g.50545 Transcript_17728/m.50545 type:complete len:161 (-) Transcript_17728:232-714(-)
MCALGLDESRAAGYTCVVVFVFWAAHHTAVELEMPFGTDANDLPLDEVNARFNRVLQRLLDLRAQVLPRPPRAPRESVRFAVAARCSGLLAPNLPPPSLAVSRWPSLSSFRRAFSGLSGKESSLACAVGMGGSPKDTCWQNLPPTRTPCVSGVRVDGFDI